MSTDASDNPAPAADPSTLTEMVVGGRLVRRSRGYPRFVIDPAPAELEPVTGRVLRGPVERWHSSPHSDTERVRNFLDGRRAYPFRPAGADANDRVGAEIERLREMDLPTVADLVVRQTKYRGPSAPIAGLFSSGETLTLQSLREIPGLGLDVIEELLTRHVSGELGMFGRIGDAEVTPADRFCPELSTPLNRAAVAVEQGRGLVVSVYDRGTDPRENRAGQPVRVVIVTALGRENLTVVAEAEADNALSTFC